VSKDKKKYRAIFISDVRLGTRHSNADKLLQFLKETKLIDIIEAAHENAESVSR
jgi:hypothetical protein